MNNTTTTATTKIKRVPYNLTRKAGKLVPGRGDAGWTVAEFATARDAAHFVATHPEAAMPCWRRFDVVAGELIQGI